MDGPGQSVFADSPVRGSPRPAIAVVKGFHDTALLSRGMVAGCVSGQRNQEHVEPVPHVPPRPGCRDSPAGVSSITNALAPVVSDIICLQSGDPGP